MTKIILQLAIVYEKVKGENVQIYKANSKILSPEIKWILIVMKDEIVETYH